jgi:2'-5' RNA ligase
LKAAIAYWLVPADPARELLREIIGILAKQFDAPRFEPHLTIFATPGAGKSPKHALKQIQAKSIRLRLRGIGFSSQFTKTLFVRLTSNQAFERLVIDLRRATNSRGKASINPHVSLLYKKIPVPIGKELASTIKLPFDEIIFDSINAMRCASPTKTRADVEAWRVITTRSLL